MAYLSIQQYMCRLSQLITESGMQRIARMSGSACSACAVGSLIGLSASGSFGLTSTAAAKRFDDQGNVWAHKENPTTAEPFSSWLVGHSSQPRCIPLCIEKCSRRLHKRMLPIGLEASANRENASHCPTWHGYKEPWLAVSKLWNQHIKPTVQIA